MTDSCCVQGELHSGTPVGYEQKLHKFDSYVSDPPQGEQPRGIIVILPDGFGWKLPNTRIMADEYAKKGNFKVIIPDFFEGYGLPTSLVLSVDAIEHGAGIIGKIKSIYHYALMLWYGIPWLRHVSPELVQPKVFEFFHNLKKTEAVNLPVGAAGFCWGGKYAVLLAADEEKENGHSLIDCAFVAHPSYLVIPDDIENVKKPLSCALAGLDKKLPQEKIDIIQKTLEEKTKNGDEEHESVTYPGALHGFALRGSIIDPEENKRGQEAEDQALKWFGKWLVV